jgi:GDPmannose 4,6-dehydratase
VEETGIVAAVEGFAADNLKIGDVIIRIDPRYFRPAEVETLLGDPTKAKQKLGWVPEITIDQLIEEMVEADLAQSRQHALLKQHGFDVSVSSE